MNRNRTSVAPRTIIAPRPPSLPALGVLSVALAAAASEGIAREMVIAYVVPAGTAGNQNFGSTLGMEFDVARPVQVRELGVFDEYSDGLFLTPHAALWDRQAQTVLANLEFTPEDPGELVDGSRFKSLAAPSVLPAGFPGTTAADGYGAGTFSFEPLAEAARVEIRHAGDAVRITWTGGGRLESAASGTGAWTAVAGATSGIEITPTGSGQFYRVKQQRHEPALSIS